ncbi:hypothetical protein GPX89_08430 [Nocardia sp. ET3-3]|uniref:Uncharacterized protein n=1 Tax=Nocardia terrae TaxID=2675851 RepID=A0A7K1USF1_9NOCA|nr:hypothetical protein [Nocardia terrae]MVU77270.1 hypothetical protein [Nocardia terrae]
MPPLDDAADISRMARVRRAEVPVDNWYRAGFALVVFGVLAAVFAFLAIWVDEQGLGLIATMAAGIGLVGGTVVVAAERRRRAAGAARY